MDTATALHAAFNLAYLACLLLLFVFTILGVIAEIRADRAYLKADPEDEVQAGQTGSTAEPAA